MRWPTPLIALGRWFQRGLCLQKGLRFQKGLRVAGGLVLACALAVGCGPVASEGSPILTSEAESAVRAALVPNARAAVALEAHEWDEAQGLLLEVLEILGEPGDAEGEDPLGGWRDQAVYNLACVKARRGDDPAEAAAWFARAVEFGLRKVAVPTDSGWAWSPGITVPHVLADPDLDRIRGQDAYKTALARYLRAGGPAVSRPASGGDPRPLVLVLAPEGSDPVELAGSWAGRGLAGRVEWAVVNPPCEEVEGRRTWMLCDADDRWAVVRIVERLDALTPEPGIDARRVHLLATGPHAAEAAWAAFLSAPRKFAGIAAVGGRFHPHAAADTLDAVRFAGQSVRFVVGERDARALSLLRSLGFEPRVVETKSDDVSDRLVGELFGD